MSFWIKRRGPQSQYTGVWVICPNREDGESISEQNEATPFAYPAVAKVRGGGGAQSIPLQNGVWEHVVFTRQGDTVQGYLNGTKVMSDTARSRFGPAMVKFSSEDSVPTRDSAAV